MLGSIQKFNLYRSMSRNLNILIVEFYSTFWSTTDQIIKRQQRMSIVAYSFITLHSTTGNDKYLNKCLNSKNLFQMYKYNY